MKITTVIKARKDYPNEGIKKGDTYYYFEPQRRKAGIRKVYNKDRKALERDMSIYCKSFQGEFTTNMQSYNERLADLDDEFLKQELLDEIEEFISKKQERLDNIPYQLQESHVLNEQIEELELLRDEVDNCEIN